MSDSLAKLDFTVVPGTRRQFQLKLYALSTCGFCRKAMNFLEAHDYHFEYTYLDQVDFDLKRDAKQELKKKYDHLPFFPILTIDDEEAISGFVEQRWVDRLGEEKQPG
jgi:glutaredoxin